MFWLIFNLYMCLSFFTRRSPPPLLSYWTTQRESMRMCVCWAANNDICAQDAVFFFCVFPQSVLLWHAKGHWLCIAVFTNSQVFCGSFRLFLRVLINLVRAAGLIMSTGNWGQTLLKHNMYVKKFYVIVTQTFIMDMSPKLHKTSHVPQELLK